MQSRAGTSYDQPPVQSYYLPADIFISKMHPWLETIGVATLSFIGVLAGIWFAKLPKPYWIIGYILPGLVVILVCLGRHFPDLANIPPICWLVRGRTVFAIAGLLTTMLVVVPLSRVSNARLRRLLWVFASLFIVNCSVWPFAAFALNRDYLLNLTTRIDRDGICRQSTDYNCGPAAAVTALRHLGFPAEEGEIAALARTTSAMGTPPHVLYETLKRRYEGTSLVCEYRHFKDVADLRACGTTIAVIKFGPLVDHYVTVLEVTDQTVIVGDPLLGRAEFPHEEFAKRWRFLGIVLRK